MALYTDSGGNPDTLVSSTGALSYSSAGRVEPDVTDVLLPAGDYWIMAIYQSTASLGIDFSGEVQYRPLSYGTSLPTTFGTVSQYTGQQFNYSIVVY